MAFKDIFFKPDESSRAASHSSEQVNTATPVQQTTSAPVSVSPQASISSNDEIVGKIWQSIIDKNLPGPDYLELKNNVNALNGMPLSDEQKLVSSFNILKANYPQFTKDTILRSIDTYIGVVNEEKTAGLAEVEQMRADNIVGKEKLIEKLKAEAEAYKKKYDEILKQIDENTTSVATERLTIDSQERVFTASIETVLNTLNSDKQKITTINI